MRTSTFVSDTIIVRPLHYLVKPRSWLSRFCLARLQTYRFIHRPHLPKGLEVPCGDFEAFGCAGARNPRKLTLPPIVI